MKDKEGCLLAIVGLPLLILLSIVANAFALMKLWNWFIPISFESLPEITLQSAMGISLVVSFLVQQTNDDKSEDDGVAVLLVKGLLKSLMRPAIALFIGWLVLLLFW